MFHKEICRDKDGNTLYVQEAEVKYVVGSGQQGNTYLIDRTGFLFQSPVGWYTNSETWGLSPGYAERSLHFNRPITEQCLFCHSNRVSLIPNSVNHFREPIIDGLTIGCERCHGPGELHAANRKAGENPGDVDYSIVNPAHLEPAQRDSVCEQ